MMRMQTDQNVHCLCSALIDSYDDQQSLVAVFLYCQHFDPVVVADCRMVRIGRDSFVRCRICLELHKIELVSVG